MVCRHSVAFHLIVWDMVSHWSFRSPVLLGCLASELQWSVCLCTPSQAPGLQIHATLPGFHVDVENLNSGLQDCLSGTLLPEPSPQLPNTFILSNYYRNVHFVELENIKKSKVQKNIIPSEVSTFITLLYIFISYACRHIISQLHLTVITDSSIFLI